MRYNNNMDDTELGDRMHQLKLSIHKHHGIIFTDLSKIYSNLMSITAELSKEAVECRRLHRPTSKYTALHTEFQVVLEFAEQQLTFASLLA